MLLRIFALHGSPFCRRRQNGLRLYFLRFRTKPGVAQLLLEPPLLAVAQEGLEIVGDQIFAVLSDGDSAIAIHVSRLRPLYAATRYASAIVG